SKSTSRDLVTEWDTRCEELIVARLAELAPGVPVLAAASGAHGAVTRHKVWVVDPSAGTVNIAHAIPLHPLSIALALRDEPAAGVVEAPAMPWSFAACKGGGATCNDERIRVSETGTLAESILASGFPYDRATTGHNFRQWEHFQRRAGACRRFGAASL